MKAWQFVRGMLDARGSNPKHAGRTMWLGALAVTQGWREPRTFTLHKERHGMGRSSRCKDKRCNSSRWLLGGVERRLTEAAQCKRVG